MNLWAKVVRKMCWGWVVGCVGDVSSQASRECSVLGSIDSLVQPMPAGEGFHRSLQISRWGTLSVDVSVSAAGCPVPEGSPRTAPRSCRSSTRQLEVLDAAVAPPPPSISRLVSTPLVCLLWSASVPVYLYVTWSLLTCLFDNQLFYASYMLHGFTTLVWVLRLGRVWLVRATT